MRNDLKRLLFEFGLSGWEYGSFAHVTIPADHAMHLNVIPRT